MFAALKYIRVSLVCLGVAGFAAAPAAATTLLVTESGTFDPSTPNTSISTSSGTFSLSFNVDSNPVVLNSSADQFDVAYTNFNYMLNGATDNAPVGSITFFDTAGFGLFSVCFTTPCPVLDGSNLTLEFFGQQIYTGSVTSPTLITGSFANSGSNAYVDGTAYNFPSVANTTVTAVTPEPSSFVLLGTGILAAVGAVRRKVV